MNELKHIIGNLYYDKATRIVYYFIKDGYQDSFGSETSMAMCPCYSRNGKLQRYINGHIMEV